MTGPIKGLENPTENDEAANKAYVDAQVSGAGTTADGKYLALAGGAMTGPIAMSGQKITGAADPTENQDVATKAYVDAHAGGGTEDALPLAGGTMTGNIDMGTHNITNLAEPTNDADAATKGYVDAQYSEYLPTAGGTMSGPIDMSGQKITGLSDASDDGDGVNFKLLDASNKTYLARNRINKTITANEVLANVEVERGNYFVIFYLGSDASKDITYSCKYNTSDNQEITIDRYNANITKTSALFCYPGIALDATNIKIIIDTTIETPVNIDIAILAIKIGDNIANISIPDNYPKPIDNPPQQVNLTTATLGTLSATNNNISGTLTLTPGTDPAVISGVKLYYTSESVLSDTEFADFPASSFEDNSYNFTTQLPAYNTLYTVKAKSYYTGSTISLTEETASEQSVTTGDAPISNIQSFSVSPYSGKRVLAQWQNPASIPEGSFTGVKIEYSTSSISTPGSGTLVYTGIGTTMQAGDSSSTYLDLPALATTYYLICYSTSGHGNGTAISAQVNTGTVTNDSYFQ